MMVASMRPFRDNDGPLARPQDNDHGPTPTAHETTSLQRILCRCEQARVDNHRRRAVDWTSSGFLAYFKHPALPLLAAGQSCPCPIPQELPFP